jgi:large subunit ribosomal protein L17
LIQGLAENLILHESIETTLEKAKDLRPYVEKLVTKAVKGGLHNRRQIIKSLQTLEAAHKLVDEIAPKMQRTSGYLRIVKTVARRGDNAQLARISFVDDLQAAPVAKAAVKKSPAADKDTK